MAASPEGRSPAFFLTASLAVMILLSACSAENTLVLNDPGFDYFASKSMRFYSLRREMIFRLNGYDPHFISYSSDEAYEERVAEILKDGDFGSLVTGIAALQRIDNVDGMNTVLLNGAPEMATQITRRVRSTALPALRQAGVYMRQRFNRDGLIPVIVLYDNGEALKDALYEGWGTDETVPLDDHILMISSRDRDVRESLETYLQKYDFNSAGFLLLAYCGPVMRELLELLPQSRNIRMILEMPDDSLYPEELDALIVPDYKGLLDAAAKALKGGEGGGIRKVADLFLEK